MKIELKHIAPYLPCKLKCHAMGEYIEGTEYDASPKPKEFEVTGTFTDSNNDRWVEAVCSEGDKHEIFFKTDFFPVLRPLAELTKEINGAVPVVEMAFIADCHFKFPVELQEIKVFQEDGCNVIQVHWKDDRNPYFEISWGIEDYNVDERNDGITMTLGGTTATHNSYNILQILFKYHFDFFRLIPAKIAVDINTINQK